MVTVGIQSTVACVYSLFLHWEQVAVFETTTITGLGRSRIS